MATPPAQNSRVEPPRPKTVPTSALVENPHNPRLLFDKKDMATLRSSIASVGILVPITVYQGGKSEKYTILDGQRRWMCAKDLDLKSVPINSVPEPSPEQNIIMMFQIHKLRRDWELMPTALKLGMLMERLKERRDGELAELTGLDPAVVSRCKKLLTFSKKFQNMMLRANPDDRVKADFFIELYPILHDRQVSAAEWYNENYIIERFLEKFEHKLSGFKAITDFRKIKAYLSAAKNANKSDEIVKKLKKFIDDDRMQISDLEIDQARVKKEAKQLSSSITKLIKDLRDADTEEFLGEKELWKKISQLAEVLRKKMSEADLRPDR